MDSVDISLALVQGLISRQFPVWSDLPIELVRPEGTLNAIYQLGTDKLIRLPRLAEFQSNIEKEFFWLPILEPQLPLPIPRILAKGTPDSTYPFSWLICERLPGLDLSKGEVVDEQRVATDLAAFVKAMQKIEPTGPKSSRGEALSTLTTEVLESIPLLSDSYDTELLRKMWHEVLKVPSWSKGPVWVHGDLHPGNLLVKDGKLAGVIDFDLTGVGDPACDMMVAWTLLSGCARELFRSLVQLDEATWLRGRGWALFLGIVGLPYYQHTNATFAGIAKQSLDNVIDDVLG